METEQAGLEVMAGCLGIVALLFAGIGLGILRLIRQVWVSREQRRRFIALVVDFVLGVDQSAAQAQDIQALLKPVLTFGSDYEELSSAIASFVPGGLSPFHNEAWLADKFRAFLSQEGIEIPEHTQEPHTVWPPRPRR